MIKVELWFSIKIKLKTKPKSKILIFLTWLLVSLSFAGLPYFCLVFETLVLKDLALKASAPDLTVGQAIGRVKFISKKIAVGFSK